MMLEKRKERTVAIPTASMADIAFLLIVFFLVSTIFSNEMGLQIILPERGEEVIVPKKNLARVYINKMGGVKIDGEPTEMDVITEKAKNMLAENDTLIFSIKTHPDSKYDNMVQVFDRLKKGGAERISFAPKDITK